MRRYFAVVAIGAFLAAVGGCGAAAEPRKEAKAVPSDRLYGSGIFIGNNDAVSDKAVVTIIRGAGFFSHGSMCLIALYVDNTQIAAVDRGESFCITTRVSLYACRNGRRHFKLSR